MKTADITKLRQQKSTADFISTSKPIIQPTENAADEERTETQDAAPEAAEVEEIVIDAAALSFKRTKENKKSRRVTLFFIPAEYDRAKAAAITAGAASFNEWATAIINKAADEIIKGGIK